MHYTLCLVLGFREDGVVSAYTKVCQTNYLVYRFMSMHTQKYTDSQLDEDRIKNRHRIKKVEE